MQQNIISVTLIDTNRNNPTPEFLCITTEDQLENKIKHYMQTNQHTGSILFVTINNKGHSTTYEAHNSEQLYLGNQPIPKLPSDNYDFITAAFNIILQNGYEDITLYSQTNELHLAASINKLYENETLANHINTILTIICKTKNHTRQHITFKIENPDNNTIQIEKFPLITKTSITSIKQLETTTKLAS